MRRAAVVLGLLAIAGCASLLDINRLEPPPDDAGVDAACSADAVTTLTFSPRNVQTALDDTDVYFTRANPPRDSAILRCSKCGCATPASLATLAQPGGIAVDDQYVFWTDASSPGTVNRIDKSDPTHLVQIPNQDSPLGITVDDTFVYWTVIGPNQLNTAGVYRATKADLGNVTQLTRAEKLPADLVPYGIAVDDQFVYYTTAPDLNDQSTTQPCQGSDAGTTFGTIRRVSKTGGLQTSTVLASGQACPLGLAIDGDTIYWSNLGLTVTGGSVWSRPKSGGTAVQLTGSLGRPTSLALSGGRLTWNAPANQTVESCTVPGCLDVTTLSNDQSNPSGLSADPSGIYWVTLGTVAQNFGDGALRRAPQP